MTDAETYAAICADFPFETVKLQTIHERLNATLVKAQTRPDGTVAGPDFERLRILTWAMRDLVDAMKMVETDGNPDEWIPF